MIFQIFQSSKYAVLVSCGIVSNEHNKGAERCSMP